MTQLSNVQVGSDRASQPTVKQPSRTQTIILAGIVGNVIEWYDFALYGYLTPVISRLFFPNENPMISLLESYGVFAAGFIMRPLGAIIFGYIGDRVSRRTELFISVILMAIPTFMLGLLPDYHQIGITAPIILIILRLLQGLSVGGEFTGSVTYVAETAPQTRRGFTASFANVGSTAGLLLGLGIVTLMTHWLPDKSLQTWGWRLPFLLGGILGLIGLYIRSNLPDSEIFQQHHENDSVPWFKALRQSLNPMLQAMFYTGGYSAACYITMVYLPSYLVQFTNFSLSHALGINAVALAVQLGIIPLMGWLSDTTLRRKFWLLITTMSMALFSLPAFWFLFQDYPAKVWVVQIGLAILLVPLLAISPAMMVELFPTETRLTAYSLSGNLGSCIMGGTSLLVCTWLINVSGNVYAPAIYLSGLMVVSTIALAFMRDRSREPLL
ncbi:MAG: MHS family MFS transporter [Cyanothece sp. SIO2G6]|nr:MHS family MFS transporter [Cyanothece sp. SIO2G6]